ncbi:hypothetical protein Salat_1901500 [Sesamum alatum]|uniref:Uncharacterized protein n=1 Tax=Sesamum alatum TaxID=300844 RepID=A0AAE1Y478_9LAMI|nr:hypothetical protein Salat_1901500 [Sesamum alatum]
MGHTRRDCRAQYEEGFFDLGSNTPFGPWLHHNNSVLNQFNMSSARAFSTGRNAVFPTIVRSGNHIQMEGNLRRRGADIFGSVRKDSIAEVTQQIPTIKLEKDSGQTCYFEPQSRKGKWTNTSTDKSLKEEDQNLPDGTGRPTNPLPKTPFPKPNPDITSDLPTTYSAQQTTPITHTHMPHSKATQPHSTHNTHLSIPKSQSTIPHNQLPHVKYASHAHEALSPHNMYSTTYTSTETTKPESTSLVPR